MVRFNFQTAKYRHCEERQRRPFYACCASFAGHESAEAPGREGGSNPSRGKERVDCFAPLAMTWKHTSTFPRRDFARVVHRRAPKENRGRRESRALAAPAALRAK